MCAYDKLYLEKAMTALGKMLEYAVYDLKYDLSDFWDKFLHSPVSKGFERGEPKYTVGKSGIELALDVLERKQYPVPTVFAARSEEYWAGWALAYYQWQSGFSFAEIAAFVSIEEVRSMYMPYHEMDVRQFCDAMEDVRRIRLGRLERQKPEVEQQR